MHTRSWLGDAVLAVACLSVAGAYARGSADSVTPFAPAAAAWAAPDDDSVRTTDPTIALTNLNAQIAALTARHASNSLEIQGRIEFAALLSARAQYGGRIADREQALRVAETAAAAHSGDPAALLARAGARAALHRFAEALADVDRAAAAGASRVTIDAHRAAILQALGRYDEALAIRLDVARRRPDSESLGALAALRAERGEIHDAAQLYAAARRAYRDVSPFPLAWLDFDEGLMWMRHGDPQRARDAFAAAHRRLPWFAAAQCHLAEMEAALGDRERAIELLRPLAETTDDPDPAGQLARILAEHGRMDEARIWRESAAARFKGLVARHPEAYADHAAEFWMNAGSDPDAALMLARRNLAIRQTTRAYELVLAAALLARDDAVLCATYGAADRMKDRSPEIADLVGRAADQCRVR